MTGRSEMNRFQEQFLKQLWKKTEEMYEEEIGKLNQNQEEMENHIASELNRQLKLLTELYHNSWKKEPRYLVISFLRTSCLDGFPWYQIRLLDEDYFYSDQEWAVWLDVPIVSSGFYNIMDFVREELRNEIRMEGYFIDSFFSEYREKFHQWMSKHIHEIMRKHVLWGKWEGFYAKHNMRILFGDYQNTFDCVMNWSAEEDNQ